MREKKERKLAVNVSIIDFMSCDMKPTGRASKIFSVLVNVEKKE